jgi:hypothetical protein
MSLRLNHRFLQFGLITFFVLILLVFVVIFGKEVVTSTPLVLLRCFVSFLFMDEIHWADQKLKEEF